MRGHRARGDRGAALVEFALTAPLLAVLVFGIIDFGWAFSQTIDLRSAAREGGRLAVVNAGVGADATARRADLVQKIRSRSTELDDNKTEVFVALLDDDSDGNPGERGETVVVCLRYPLQSLTGFTKTVLSGTMQTKAVMRMEQVASFSSGSSTSPSWSGSSCGP